MRGSSTASLLYRRADMLNPLFRLTATAIYRVVQEYKELEAGESVRLGMMDDGTLGPDDPADDVYCETIGFSVEKGRLRPKGN